MSNQKCPRIEEIKTTRVLEPSNLPDADFVINPYIGCSIGCLYCYACQSSKEVNESIDMWGSFVYAKVNAVDILSLELEKCLWSDLINKKILLSAKTDPYQACEATYQTTRKILYCLAQKGFPGAVGILTKSPLVLRDIDIFCKLQHVEIGLTITTLDEQVARNIENHAPAIQKRLITLQRLHEERINTFAFVGPLLPHYVDKPDLLEELFHQLKNVGVQSVFVEHLNYSSFVEHRLKRALLTTPNLQKYTFEDLMSATYRERLEEMVSSLIKKSGLLLRFGKVLYHGKVN